MLLCLPGLGAGVPGAPAPGVISPDYHLGVSTQVLLLY